MGAGFNAIAMFVAAYASSSAEAILHNDASLPFAHLAAHPVAVDAAAMANEIPGFPLLRSAEMELDRTVAKLQEAIALGTRLNHRHTSNARALLAAVRALRERCDLAKAEYLRLEDEEHMREYGAMYLRLA